MMKASAMSLTTQVYLMTPRRAFQRWFPGVSSRLHFFQMSRPGMFSTSHLIMSLCSCTICPLSTPQHRFTTTNLLPVYRTMNECLRHLREILPAGRTETHLRQLRVIIEHVSRLPGGVSFGLLRARLTATIAETAGSESALGGTPSSRGFAQGTFCLRLVRRVVAAWVDGSGGEPACLSGFEDPAAVGGLGSNEQEDPPGSEHGAQQVDVGRRRSASRCRTAGR